MLRLINKYYYFIKLRLPTFSKLSKILTTLIIKKYKKRERQWRGIPNQVFFSVKKIHVFLKKIENYEILR